MHCISADFGIHCTSTEFESLTSYSLTTCDCFNSKRAPLTLQRLPGFYLDSQLQLDLRGYRNKENNMDHRVLCFLPPAPQSISTVHVGTPFVGVHNNHNAIFAMNCSMVSSFRTSQVN